MAAARFERWRRKASGVTLAALLSSSAACATMQQSYRTGRGHDQPPVVSPDDGVTLATIEFDDQGVPWTPPRSFGPDWTRNGFEQFCRMRNQKRQYLDPKYDRFCKLVDSTQIRDFCRSGLSKWHHPDYPPPSQLECVEKEIEELATNSSLKAVTVIIFVHGWKNDASDRAPNLRGFQDFLRTQKSSLLVGGKDQGAVLGIYIGWRGQVFPGQEAVNVLPRQLSIFNRGQAASRVAYLGAQTAILTVAGHAREKLGSDQSKNLRVIVIGHSLGGRVVEEALTSALLGYSLLSLPSASVDAARADALRCHQQSCEAASRKAFAEAEACKNLKELAGESSAAETKAKGSLEKALADCAKIRSLLRDEQCPVAESHEELSAEPEALQKILKKVDKPCQRLSPNDPKSKHCKDFKAAVAQLAENRKNWRNTESNVSSEPAGTKCPLPAGVARSDLAAQTQESFKSANGKGVRFRDEERLARREETTIRKGLPRRPVDLILLVNPASRAIGAKKLISSLMASEERLHGIDPDRPLVIAVSSKKDWATRWLFPRAMTVGSMNESFRDDPDLAEFLGRISQAVSAAENESPQSGDMAELRAWLKEIPEDMAEFRAWLKENPNWYGELRHLGPTQHALIRRTAPHHPMLRSHEVLEVSKQKEAEQRGASQLCFPFIESRKLSLCELPRLARWNDSQFWVFQAPEELSAKHAVPWEKGVLSDILSGLIDVSRVTQRRVAPPEQPCPENLECSLSPE